MRAIVNVNHRDMRGSDHKVHEVVGNRVTLECVLYHETILVDFNIREVQLLVNDLKINSLTNKNL